MRIQQTSFFAITNDIITIYKNGDEHVLEMCSDGEIKNITLEDFSKEELKEIVEFIQKAIDNK